MNYQSYDQLYASWQEATSIKEETTELLKRYRQRVLGRIKREINNIVKTFGAPVVHDKYDGPITLTLSVIADTSYNDSEIRYVLRDDLYLSDDENQKVKDFKKMVIDKLKETGFVKRVNVGKSAWESPYITIDASKLDIVID